MNKINKKVRFKVKLKLETGLHIGGSNLSMAIGGADAVVIRDPMTQQPIIPGSSVKGKMRSLTEKILGAYEEVNMGAVKYGPYSGTESNNDEFNIVPQLFGRVGGKDNENIPSRLIVRDAHMNSKSIEELEHSEDTDMLFSEVKTEVVIDRVTSAAMPRQIERVPAGTEFDLYLVLNVFDGDDEGQLVNYTKVGLRLLEDDYLGGNGSRGSGEISIDWENLKLEQKTLSDYEDGNDWQEHEA